MGLGIKATIATAKALFEIHSFGDGRLWKAEYPTFEAYCRARWDLKKSQAYRLVECGKFIAALEAASREGDSPFGERLPKNEGQIRPLLSLPEEQRLECWNGILVDTAPSALTARVVAGKVKEFAEARELPGFAPGDKQLAEAAKRLGQDPEDGIVACQPREDLDAIERNRSSPWSDRILRGEATGRGCGGEAGATAAGSSPVTLPGTQTTFRR